MKDKKFCYTKESLYDYQRIRSEQHAIGFANWLSVNYTIDCCYYVDSDYNRYTTEELYKLYLESL